MRAVGEDTAKNLVSVLGKSTAELKAQAAGFSISTQSMAEAQVASQQLKESQALLDKAGTDLTISLAPLATILAEKLPEGIQWCRDQFDQFAPTVKTAMRIAVQSVGFLMDTWEGAKSGVQFFVGAVVTGFGAMVEGLGEAIRFLDKIGKAMKVDVGLGGAADAVKEFGDMTKKVGLSVMDDAAGQFAKFGEQQAAALAWFDSVMQKREDRVEQAVKKLTPGGQVPNEIKTSVKVDVMKGVEAAVQGSAKWQEAVARSYMMNRFGEQNKQLQAQNKANVILEQIKTAVSRPMIQFGVL